MRSAYAIWGGVPVTLLLDDGCGTLYRPPLETMPRAPTKSTSSVIVESAVELTLELVGCWDSLELAGWSSLLSSLIVGSGGVL